MTCPVLAVFYLRFGIRLVDLRKRPTAPKDENGDLPTMYNTEVIPKKDRLLQRIEDWEDGL